MTAMASNTGYWAKFGGLPVILSNFLAILVRTALGAESLAGFQQNTWLF